MSEIQLMQQIPATNIQTMQSGFSTGVGIVTGVVVATLVFGGLYYIATGKVPFKKGKK
jgi:hypothetical protein